MAVIPSFCLVQGHVFWLVLLVPSCSPLLIFLQGLDKGLHVAGGGSGNGLVPQAELADERGELGRLEGGGEQAQCLLELGGTHGSCGEEKREN
jgi:hypothetical protein